MLDDMEKPEKFRFSVGSAADEFDDDPKSCVMVS